MNVYQSLFADVKLGELEMWKQNNVSVEVTYY